MTRAGHVLVVGAGPVGVVAGLAAAQAGFRVTVCEAEADIDTSPRASTTHPSTPELIHPLGLLQRYIAQGLVAATLSVLVRPGRPLVAAVDHEQRIVDIRLPL